jgi:D-alanyl-D-alanine carboxypeptidase
MKIAPILFMLVLGLLSACESTEQAIAPQQNCVAPGINPTHPLAGRLQMLIDSFVAEGIPGAVVAVKDSRGVWAGASGLSKLEDNTPMQTCQVQHAYSVSKTFIAVATLRLAERGLLKLDDPIATYLPSSIANRLTQAKGVTVRMLLNQTSGYREFHEDLKRLSDLLNRPTRPWSREELLEYVIEKPLLFQPGTDWAYANTNYLLLTYVLEKASGKDHAEVIKAEILEPLQLKNTYYKLQSGYPGNLTLPNHYWDRYANGVLENCTQTNLNIAAYSGYGEDGVIASPLDLVTFMDALANGKLLNAQSWREMTSWVQGKQSTEPDYGLGLVWVNFGGGQPEFGHYGGGIGGQCSLIYLPQQKITVFTSTNVGREGGGRFAFLSSVLVNRVPEALAKLP